MLPDVFYPSRVVYQQLKGTISVYIPGDAALSSHLQALLLLLF
ncbi:hypothetical protein ANAPC5_00695 [Anaplasma phagocytophilum]|nr:hypothetical protein ANAPC4_00632 [Anaplasma phagocytophilum]SBO31918.1 hypothetical protein ANAPC2_00846 [Anaplasma phagocytophilum]SBO31919.1 hypothetical protein ANAPC3_00686 [Anaplasma phagocytophilum]SCV63869.1 hypothetical protein ANAPC5_00695 [Anaplasma phagocytophilum]